MRPTPRRPLRPRPLRPLPRIGRRAARVLRTLRRPRGAPARTRTPRARRGRWRACFGARASSRRRRLACPPCVDALLEEDPPRRRGPRRAAGVPLPLPFFARSRRRVEGRRTARARADARQRSHREPGDVPEGVRRRPPRREGRRRSRRPRRRPRAARARTGPPRHQARPKWGIGRVGRVRVGGGREPSGRGESLSTPPKKFRAAATALPDAPPGAARRGAGAAAGAGPGRGRGRGGAVVAHRSGRDVFSPGEGGGAESRRRPPRLRPRFLRRRVRVQPPAVAAAVDASIAWLDDGARRGGAPPRVDDGASLLRALPTPAAASATATHATRAGAPCAAFGPSRRAGWARTPGWRRRRFARRCAR